MSNWSVGKHKVSGFEIWGAGNKLQVADRYFISAHQYDWDETKTYRDFLFRDTPKEFHEPILEIVDKLVSGKDDMAVNYCVTVITQKLFPAILKFAEQVKDKALNDYLDIVEPNK
jgi:hypothetical protein